MELALIVDTEGNTPLYQQLKYQFIYLISSRQLSEGERLPTIRELAESLQINLGTVAQAYRELQVEGLIESARGRGTFVRTIIPHQFTNEEVARETALTDTLTEALSQSFSLGFAANEIQQRVASLLSRESWLCHLAFVGPTREIADKHATLLQEQLGENNALVIGVDIASLERGEVPDGFDSVFYVTTFVSLVHGVEKALAQYPRNRRILPLSTRISEYTLGSLAILPSNLKACLIAEERNLHSALNLITTHSRIPKTLPTADLTLRNRVSSLCKDADVVIHTFYAGALLDSLNVTPSKRLELRFEIDPDSLSSIRQLLRIASKLRALTDPTRNLPLAAALGRSSIGMNGEGAG